MTKKFGFSQKIRHKSSGLRAHILSMSISSIGTVYTVTVAGVTLIVLEQDLEPY